MRKHSIRIVLPVCLGVLLCAAGSWADIVHTSKGKIEGRVLENSSKVSIVETIAGEYVVIDKSAIERVEEEPVTEFYFRRGRYHEGRGNENFAMLDYLEALNIDPEHSKSKERIDQMRHQQRQSVWNKGLQKAQQHISDREYRQALEAYQEVLSMNPDENLAQRIVKMMSDTHTQIAYLYYNHCADQDAILELAKAEELNPESADIYFVLGRIHESNREYDQARLEYERALQLDPNHSSARENLRSLIERTRNRYGVAHLGSST